MDSVVRSKYNAIRDRIGPDLISTHWMLHFKILMKLLCKKKFLRFCDTSECRPGSYFIACSKISIGENVVIRPGTMLFADPRVDSDGCITIEDNAMVGSGVHIYVANHKYNTKGVNIINQGHCSARSVVLRKGCWVGANSTILPGVEIGSRSVVGAGSVVTKDVPPNTVYAGNPARMIKEI